eukprot:TRINITY_DN7410_c0_g1_i2.p1 TRINITY_DN7410_c0_g1~~TRINITY_DN7410_c0_g1_i2.p1  ORF type:complete len:132 (+),score=3.54 TRINITY_DN7410_c0_g1_i2:661-1056(+)
MSLLWRAAAEWRRGISSGSCKRPTAGSDSAKTSSQLARFQSPLWLVRFAVAFVSGSSTLRSLRPASCCQRGSGDHLAAAFLEERWPSTASKVNAGQNFKENAVVASGGLHGPSSSTGMFNLVGQEAQSSPL